MINPLLIENKIKEGKAEVLKKNQRKVNGFNVYKVLLDGVIYRFCTSCSFYKKEGNFYEQSKCKECINKYYNNKYHNSIDYNIRQKWHSINSRVKGEANKCTKEEFEHFFKNERCPYTHRTLEQDFNEPNQNKLFMLEVDHIKPISEGGSSNINNLRVVPRFINQAKKNGTQKEWLEVENFLFNQFTNNTNNEKK